MGIINGDGTRRTRNRMILGHRSDNRYNPVPESKAERRELLAMGRPIPESTGRTTVSVIHGQGYQGRADRRGGLGSVARKGIERIGPR